VDTSGGFTHAALVFDSDDVLRDRLVPQLRDALARDEHLLLVVGARAERVLRAELGAAASAVEWADQQLYHQRLGFTVEGFRRYVAGKNAEGRVVRLVAEPDIAPSGPVDREAAYLAYESMCNETFASLRATVLCLWDSGKHSTIVIEGVRSTHPFVLERHGRRPSPGYVPPQDYLAGRDAIVLADPPATREVRELVVEGYTRLAQMRREVRERAERLGFDGRGSVDVITAVNEVATNALQHGRPPVRVRLWHELDTLVVQVDDTGTTPIPPRAGYRCPAGDELHSHGLWVARQLADVLTVHTGPYGTSVRLYFPRVLTHVPSSY
jgi:anti-sigma regulatory factor (Ser/Thr protein kinase)